jgi:hypothetical protein
VHGRSHAFQSDPHWRDLILFYEYFHGDSGAGVGASHQTGWTGLVATLIQFFAENDAETLLKTEARTTDAAISGAAADQHARVA